MAKNVLLYCTQLLETGGIENHILEFINKMASREVEIDLIVANFQMNSSQEQNLRKRCRKLIIRRKKEKLSRIIWLFFTTLSLIHKRYDSLYTNGQGESIAVVSKMVRFKNWVHHHHTSGDILDQETWGKLYRKILKNANTVIACSNRNAADINLAVKREIDVITCFSRKINITRRKPGIEKVKFGYFGRLIPEKGISTICKLSEDPECSDVEFHIWGKGEAYSQVYFQDFPKIQYHGSYSGIEELQNIISSLDAYILLSVHPEGLPISLLESMSAGLPWLATDKGGIPDIACDPESTRIISYTSTYLDIKKVILDFASDLRNGNVSGEKQQEIYNTRFSSEVLVSQWKNVLQV